MTRSAVLQACGAALETLGQRVVAVGADRGSALRTAFNACRCYLSPVCCIEQLGDNSDDGLTRKILADGSRK